MHILRRHHFPILLSLAGLLFCTPALAQSMDPGAQSTSPRPIPLQPGTPEQSGKTGNTPTVDPHDQARVLLSGYHNIPPKAAFDSNLKQPQQVLMDVAQGENTLPLQRQRAVEALAYYADAKVEGLYRSLLEDKKSPEMLRHRVMGLLAVNFPKTALPTLEPYLAHSDLQFRLSAIDAIRRIPGDAALQTLQRASKSETHKVAQKRLAQYLRTTR
ncbi:HEAT repeat domain-containing protein [Bradymonas sediminis]|uniref:Uncharacterized protein n=1 Tax=Bradymonas sediminis TaxID=1548548 RepID=A0A2Z4FNG0_9DELT|nr:HEAT repeat domain-containing protein [Bradymonas sediminis]AWV90519.1 hypothetical protein DN745_14760 [Bradymonas sediminis]TDP72088.1 hypothetical protein DFR33_10768 [Bradymonas sediminis]